MAEELAAERAVLDEVQAHNERLLKQQEVLQVGELGRVRTPLRGGTYGLSVCGCVFVGTKGSMRRCRYGRACQHACIGACAGGGGGVAVGVRTSGGPPHGCSGAFTCMRAQASSSQCARRPQGLHPV